MSDCLVVGGGIIGMLTALELADAGLEVTLLERGETGREASWAGGGILSPLFPWRYPDAVTQLAAWSQDHYEALALRMRDASGIDPEWTRNGLLVLETGERGAAEEWARRHHRRVELVDGRAAHGLEPNLAKVPEAAIWMPEVAQIRNPRLVQALHGALEAGNIRIQSHTPVEGLLFKGERVAGVNTPAGRLEAERVVIAAGAWSGRLLAADTEARLPVEPVRGQMLLFHAGPDLLRRIVLAHEHYLIPRRDGRVLVGSTVEYTGFDKSTTTEAEQKLRTFAVELVPGLAECPVERHWAGLRPSSPKGIPYIGELPGIRGLYVNAGHYRNGVVLAPASARLLADLVTGRAPILDPAPYRPVG